MGATLLSSNSMDSLVKGRHVTQKRNGGAEVRSKQILRAYKWHVEEDTVYREYKNERKQAMIIGPSIPVIELDARKIERQNRGGKDTEYKRYETLERGVEIMRYVRYVLV